MKRVALYVRVSTEEQKLHGISVDNQISALKEYCKENKYKVAGIYNDAGISARKSYKKRPALLKLIEDCKEGKIDLIIFTKLDRWFRSVADYYEVQRLLDECSVKWRCIWEDYETETSSGVFKVNIMLSVAQSEADRTSERIRATNEYKRSLGQVCSGGVALGYKIKNKRWYIDENMEKYVRKFYEVYLDTFSIKLAVKACDELGYHFSPKNATRFLRNPSYWGGNYFVAEAYITEEQHKIIEPTLKKHPRNRVYTHLFSGIAFCGYCGKLMSPQGIRKDRSKFHPRYVCHTRANNINDCIGASTREADLEEYLLNNLDEILKDAYISAEFTANTTDKKAKLSQLKSKLNRIKDLYVLGDIELEQYKEKRDKLLEEISEIENEEETTLPVLPSNWKEIYAELDREHKHAFWQKIIKRIDLYGRMLSEEPKVYF